MRYQSLLLIHIKLLREIYNALRIRSVGFMMYFIDHYGWEISYGNINGTKENSLLPNNLYCCKPTTGQLDFAGCRTKTNINSTFLGCFLLFLTREPRCYDSSIQFEHFGPFPLNFIIKCFSGQILKSK